MIFNVDVLLAGRLLSMCTEVKAKTEAVRPKSLGSSLCRFGSGLVEQRLEASIGRPKMNWGVLQ